jgi:la-related protein 1
MAPLPDAALAHSAAPPSTGPTTLMPPTTAAPPPPPAAAAEAALPPLQPEPPMTPEHALPRGDSAEDRQARVRWQIEYYFSQGNLIRDKYLRCLMDADGWVPVVMLAAFPKVARERLALPAIIDALAQ